MPNNNQYKNESAYIRKSASLDTASGALMKVEYLNKWQTQNVSIQKFNTTNLQEGTVKAQVRIFISGVRRELLNVKKEIDR